MTGQVIEPHPRKRRWLRRFVLIVFIVVGLVLFRRPLFRFMASGLVSESAVTTDGDLVVMGGDRKIDRAVEFVQAHQGCQVHLFRQRPQRIQQIGVLPRWEEIDRQKLLSGGLRCDQIHLFDGEAATTWDCGRILRDWLRQNPGKSVTVLTDRFSSTRTRWLIFRTIDPIDRNRVHLIALANREYDESNWWQNKSGLLSLFNSYISLVHIGIIGESPNRPPPHPEDFDRMLK